MKKILTLSLIACGIFASSAFAECSKSTCTKPEKNTDLTKDYTITSKDSTGKEFYLDISNIKKDIHLGLSSVNVHGERAADWTLGLGISGVVDKNIYIGANIDSEFVNVNGDSILGVTGETKLGYVFENGISGYGLVGVKSMNYKNDINGVGFGAGVGAEYPLCSKVIGAIEYKNYDMTMEGSSKDYNHESLGIKVRYLF